jgi:hypothetical protein
MSETIASSSITSTQRSTFVTVLSWLLIVGAGYCTFIAILQAIAFTFFMPSARFWSDPGPVRGLEQVPALAQFMLSNITAFFVFGWLLFATSFLAAIGLLYRRNWARIYFVVAFSLLALLQFAVLVAQWQMMSIFDLSKLPNHTEAESMFVFAKLFGATFVVALTVLLGWLVKRLTSRSVRAEFGAP